MGTRQYGRQANKRKKRRSQLRQKSAERARKVEKHQANPLFKLKEVANG